VKVDKQVAEREQVRFERPRIHSFAKYSNNLLRHKMIQVFDRREMGIGITRGKLNRSSHTLEEGLKGIVKVDRLRTWHPGRDRITAMPAAQRQLSVSLGVVEGWPAIFKTFLGPPRARC
jgi:hypothetical protein